MDVESNEEKETATVEEAITEGENASTNQEEEEEDTDGKTTELDKGIVSSDTPQIANATTPMAGKKRNRGDDNGDGGISSINTATAATTVSISSAAAASQLAQSMGLHGLAQLLNLSILSGTASNSTSNSTVGTTSGGNNNNNNNSSNNNNGGSSSSNSTLPTLEQVQQTANKVVQESPPFVHLSKTDSAPQLKIDEKKRLLCKGGMRGYRMTRASHCVGPASGNYYYEVIILESPTVQEIINSLPPNVRISKGLQEEMQQALKMEQERAEKNKRNDSGTEDDDIAASDTPKLKDTTAHASNVGFGSHVRLGWSMRTGDLQAPVGYDKWSYGVRDIGGSKIHCSKREDHWGGEEFGPGDVIGCAISMVPDSTMEGAPTPASGNRENSLGTSGSLSHQQHQAMLQQPQPNQNHIRFFKNGFPMGEFIISKGKREGGAAFIIPDGMYFPAISLYMGASVKVSFGPHFIYQPRKLPTGLKLQPLSKLCNPPISSEDAAAKVIKERPFRKPDMQQKFLELVQAEVQILQEAYQTHRQQHVVDVFKEREMRNLKTDDLENDDYFAKPMEE